MAVSFFWGPKSGTYALFFFCTLSKNTTIEQHMLANRVLLYTRDSFSDPTMRGFESQVF
jgi:hypothetical protein